MEDDTKRKIYVARQQRNCRKPQEDRESETIKLNEKESQRVLALSKAQQLEIQVEEAQQSAESRRKQHQHLSHASDEDDTFSQNDDFSLQEENNDDDGFVLEHNEGYVTIAEGANDGLSAEEERIVASLMTGSGGEERRTLADIILEKIEEKEAEKRGEMMSNEEGALQLPRKVVEVYTDIGKLLSRYTSGKLPKAFKVIPSLSNWEEILYLTRPDLWTPQAMYAATRLFASNLNPKMAQRFYRLVLLDSVRTDIMQHKKLNYHYYTALKKSVYKPAAFFKGILFPLCQESCTLREAAIVASVLQRVSIPVHHSAVAIHKLAQEQQYTGASSIFIKTLLNKKYSLPAPVIGSLVRHFAAFITDDRTLPVLWHQALLVFVQRYKNEVQDEARESLRRVMKKHFHHKITPEIRRELFGWKEERNQAPTDNLEL
jgi:essential nuclear protein 1